MPGAPPPLDTQDRTLSVERANLLALALILPLAGVVALPFTAVWHRNPFSAEIIPGVSTFVNGLLSLVVFAAAVALHEGLHALGYWLGGARHDQISFGILLGNPFAHCSVPLRVNAYRFAVALPALALGVGPALIGTLTGNATLNTAGLVMLLAAGGDLLVLWMLRDLPARALVSDHPERVGCLVTLPAASDPR